MDRVIVTNNTRVNFSSVFTDLQNNIETELSRIYADIFQEFGVVAPTVSGIIDPNSTDLLLTQGGATNHIVVGAGHGVTSTGELIIVSAPGETFTVSGTGTLYIEPKVINTNFVEYVAGFQYGGGEAVVPSRSITGVKLTTTDPGVSGILLGDVTMSGTTITDITDRRSENLLKLNLDLYDEVDVVRTNQNSVITATVQLNALVLKSMTSENLLTISGGIDTNVNISLANLRDINTWKHTHVEDTLIPADVTITASGINNFFNNGIVNLGDGAGDLILTGDVIPSRPTTVSGIATELNSYLQTSTFGESLLADLATYRASRISIVQETNKRNSMTRIQGVVTSWLVNNSGLAWEDTWTDLTVIDAYNHTISGLGQWIVDYGYATRAEVGFSGPNVGTTGSDLATYMGTVADLAENERAILSSTTQALGESIAIQTERIRNQPELTKPIYKAKVTWPEPTLVNNESLIKYEVKIFKMVAGDYSTIPTYPQMTSNDINVQSTIAIETAHTSEARTILEAIGTKSITTVNSDTSFVLSNIAEVQSGDFIEFGSGGGDQSKIDSVSAGTLTVTLIKPFNTAPVATNNLSIRRKKRESTDGERAYSITVDRDQTYIVYVRAVSDQNIRGHWSTGELITTNALTIGADTLLNLLNSRDAISREAEQAKTEALRAELEDTTAELSRQIAAQPDMVAINNLTAAFKVISDRLTAAGIP